MKNPFNTQGPSDPRYYANRGDLLGAFRQNVIAVKESGGVTRPVNMAIMGRWGIGKTSTLYKFKDILARECRGARVFSSIISLKPSACSDADTFSSTLLETIFKDYSATARLPEKVRNFIADEINLLEKWKVSKISVSPEIERKQREVKAISFRDSLMRFWDKLKSNGFDLAVVMVDDIHYVVTQERGELLLDLRTDMQTLAAEGARFMFVVTGPANLYPEMRDKAEPFTRLFERFELEPFDMGGTRELVEKPLKVEKIPVSVSGEVTEKIHAITEGHPYFVTLVMRDLLNNIQKGDINERRFSELYPDLAAHFAKVKFDDDFAKATDSEKIVLRKMAGLRKEEIPLSEVGGRAQAKFLERLVGKELVIKVARGKYRLYNKLFGEYISKLRNP